ncbi:hypothetical protein [Azonexus sp.]|uniref:hypothetical protein n=1 Tax=Azonexus sp. TaxID=1872668 RepID=UPI0027BA525B|nr:hypothetical protein [Azonexus sp.]
MISSTQGSSSAAWGQLQQQQAQRNAEQAEQRARSLQTMAQAAQREADQAQGNARNLKIDSSQARTDADSAQRNVAAMSSLNTVNTQLGELRNQISNVLSSPSVASTTPSAYTNVDGQATGTLINITA